MTNSAWNDCNFIGIYKNKNKIFLNTNKDKQIIWREQQETRRLTKIPIIY